MSNSLLALADTAQVFTPSTTAESTVPSGLIKATPFVWRDPANIPRREWLHGRHLIRRYVSVTVAAGGVGKTALTVADALEMTTGRALTSEPDRRALSRAPLRVWLWNLEDPRDELERRVTAAMLHYVIAPEEVGGRLYLDSGRDQPLCIVTESRDGLTIQAPVVEALVGVLTERKIDALVVDPFVSSHAVNENDNGAIDSVAKTWGRVAERANCAIELVHHLRKLGDQEATAEHARGAVALIGAARSVRVLNRMTAAEGERAGVENYRLHFRADIGKSNLGPPPDKARWHKLVGVDLPNGDNVGVVTAWQWPDPLAGVEVADLLAVQKALDGQERAENVQANDWAGHVVAEALGVDAADPVQKARIKSLLRVWVKNGALAVRRVVDPKKGRERPVIEVGAWADE